MNLKKCLQVLQLQQAGSKSDVEQAYHEMIETWRPGTSGKYLWVGLIILLALVSIFAIRYLKMLDKKSSPAQPQSSLLKRLTPETKTTNKALPKKQRGAEPTGVMHPQNEKKPAAAPEVFEIHLKQGDIIRVQRWWQQGNMVMYTTKYGTMGVEKNAVEQIVSR